MAVIMHDVIPWASVTAKPISWLLVAWGPFYQHGLTSILVWISNHMPNKVWDKIAYPFPKVNGAIIEFVYG